MAKTGIQVILAKKIGKNVIICGSGKLALFCSFKVMWLGGAETTFGDANNHSCIVAVVMRRPA